MTTFGMPPRPRIFRWAAVVWFIGAIIGAAWSVVLIWAFVRLVEWLVSH